MNRSARIVVIGGGASGFFGAIRCAGLNPDCEVMILESTNQPLDKVRISGGGRCNVTCHCFDPAELAGRYPRGYRELRGAFSRFQPQDTIAWFEERGVVLKVEADGRMFPVTDASATIVDCLTSAATKAGVTLHNGARVQAIENLSSGDNINFRVSQNHGEPIEATAILLASGSAVAGHQIAESLGHSVVPCVPSLFTFKVIDSRIADLSGISVSNVDLMLQIGDRTFAQSGPLLITHWGLSGPAVLKLSAFAARELHDAHYRATLRINWIPSHSTERLQKAIDSHRARSGTRPVLGHNPDAIPRRLWEKLCHHAGITETTTWSHLTRSQLDGLVNELLSGEYLVTGKGQFKEEFVTCGGIKLKEVDFRTMQSRICPGLFLAGEILDIDGITGGYNFQAAWTTGWIAGSHIGPVKSEE